MTPTRITRRCAGLLLILAVPLATLLITTTPTSHTPPTHASLSDSPGTTQLYDGLYQPTLPSEWCQLGDNSHYEFDLPTGPQDLNVDGCQVLPGPPPTLIPITNDDPGGDKINCTGEQGPANDADIDPSGVSLYCIFGNDETETIGIHTYSDALNWSIWAELTGTSGIIAANGGNQMLYTITGAGATQTLAIKSANCDYACDTISITPPPAFTQETGWVELSETSSPPCFYVDQTSICGNSYDDQNIFNFTMGGVSVTPLIVPGPDAYWGWGTWANGSKLRNPPTWTDFSTIGCTGIATSACSPITDDAGTSVIPATCTDTGTLTITTGTDAGKCTWANLPAFWYAWITQVSTSSGSGAYTGTGPAGTACSGGVIMPLSGACKPGVGLIGEQNCSAFSTSALDVGADVQWLLCNLGNFFINIANFFILVADAFIDIAWPDTGQLSTAMTADQTALTTHVPFSYVVPAIEQLEGLVSDASPSSPNLGFTFWTHTETINLLPALTLAANFYPLISDLIWVLLLFAILRMLMNYWFDPW